MPAALAGLSSASLNHDHTHGYRIADSTRFPVFPTIRGVTTVPRFPADPDKNISEDKLDDHQAKGTSRRGQNEVGIHGHIEGEGEEPDKDAGQKKEGNGIQNKEQEDDWKSCDKSLCAAGDNPEEEKNHKLVSLDSQLVLKTESTTIVNCNAGEMKDKEGKADSNSLENEAKLDLSAASVMIKAACDSGDIENEPESLSHDKKIIWSDEPRSIWTAEEDLRLLDAISSYGLGNWADIADAVSGAGDGGGGAPIPATSQKSARRCMERYCDDYLGRYGNILPKYTLVEVMGGDDEDNADKREAAIENSVALEGIGKNSVGVLSQEGKEVNDSTVTDDQRSVASMETESSAPYCRKRKVESRRSPVPFQRQVSSNISVGAMASSSVNGGGSVGGGTGFRSAKRYRVIPTSSLPEFHKMWQEPYLPTIKGVHMGDEVNRDLAFRAEQDFVKSSNSLQTKGEYDALRKEWTEKRLAEYVHGGRLPRVVLPPRLEDVRTMTGSELAGYMPRRGDFDVEWDNDAEQILADMEFGPNDPHQDRLLKIHVIEIYNAKLDEREHRKKFLLDRNLIDYRENQRRDMMLSPDERDLVNRMRLFARFHSQGEHERFVNDLLKAKRLRKEIAQLQLYRRMGITSLAEAERYELDKVRREHHRFAVRQKEMEEQRAAGAGGAIAKAVASVQGGISSADGTGGIGITGEGGPVTSGLWRQYKSRNRKGRSCIDRSELESDGTDFFHKSSCSRLMKEKSEKNLVGNETSSDQNHSQSHNEKFNIVSEPGYDLLSPKEVCLCKKIQLLPKHYLEAKRTLISESLSAGLLEKKCMMPTTRSIFKIDVEKRDSVIDFILRAGWISTRPISHENNK